jgi:SAM-dependent methyltransferase
MATVHEVLADLTASCAGKVVVDLGAGAVGTLPSLISHGTPALAVALDQSLAALSTRTTPEARIAADLSCGLPFAARSVDLVLSHNTLECLASPHGLMGEIARVLRPDGRALLSHTDFDSISVVADDRDLCYRIIRTYGDLPVVYAGMASADAQMGRRLAGLVRNSPLTCVWVRAHVTIDTDFTGPAATRVQEMAAAVRNAAAAGLGYVTTAEVENWLQDLAQQRDRETFFFSETAYVVEARRG